MVLSAFVAFSALVGVSVALSNGTAPAPWESAAAREAPDSSSREQAAERAAAGQAADHGVRGYAEDQEDARHEASLFAVAPDPARVIELRPGMFAEGGAGAWDGAGPQLVNVTGPAGGQGASSLAPATRAPARFEGELPVNTIIAPAQPVTVLDGGQFGWRIAPDTGQRDFHNGTDISVPQGTPVVAALDGTVTAVFWDVWGGNRVEVTHADGLKTTYNHMEHVMVRQGDELRASEQLGTAGQTGLRVTGPHLHFETYVNDRVVDAQSFDWKIGEEVIAASRPQQSLADQAPVPQAPVDTGARPGTDNGSLADVPPSAHDHVVALSESVAPTHDPDGKPGAGAAGGKATPNGSGGPANHEADTRKDKTLEAVGKPAAGSTIPGKTPPGQKDSVAKSPVGGGPGSQQSAGQDDTDDQGKRPDKSTAVNPGADKKARPKPDAGEKLGAGSTSKDTAGPRPGAATPPQPVNPRPTKTAAPAKEHPAATKPAAPGGPQQGTGDSTPGKGSMGQESGTVKPPSQPAASEDPAVSEKPETQPEAGVDKIPVTQPEGGGKAPDIDKDTATDGKKPGSEPQTPPQQSPVNPYTAPIEQLTTLEQVQQRTQYLLGQQTGPSAELGTALASLSTQLTDQELGAQDATFAQQLTKTQQAVTQAATAPADRKLAEQAAQELKALRGLVANVPPFVETAAVPGTK